MTEQETFDKLVICPVCGVRKEGDSFFFSFKPKKAVTPDEVYSKVCRHAKKTGCINLSAEYNENLDYPEAPLPTYL